MEDPLKLSVGKIPELLAKNLRPEVIEAWRTELRRDLHRRSLLEKILTDPHRMPLGGEPLDFHRGVSLFYARDAPGGDAIRTDRQRDAILIPPRESTPADFFRQPRVAPGG